MSVFISGASSGIGEACARIFAAHRYDLVLVARREDRLKRLAEELKSKHDIQIHCFELDVRNREKVQTLLHAPSPEIASILEGVEIVINNAGLASGLDPIQEGQLDDWDTMIDTNLKGLLYVTRAFLPQMIRQKRGHIVNLGSVAGQWVYPKGNVYCATKFAVRALTEGLRMDLAGTGIRVTEIAPGKVETEFSQVRFHGDLEKAKAVYAGSHPLSPTDIAEAILWCVQRPAHVNIQQLTLFPTDQGSVK